MIHVPPISRFQSYILHSSLYLIVLVHQRVVQHVGRKLARFALLPSRDFERRGMAPRLECELLVDDAREARGPLEARKRCDGLFDERRAHEVRAARSCVSNAKGFDSVTYIPTLSTMVASWSTCPTAVMFPPVTNMSWWRMTAYKDRSVRYSIKSTLDVPRRHRPLDPPHRRVPR